tara:strand:- start:1460 stop:4453 length:2994 start_codon:yes stop_codon:yes gene_type:complete
MADEEQTTLEQLIGPGAGVYRIKGEGQQSGTLFEPDPLTFSEQNQLFNALGLRDMEKQNVFKKESFIPDNDIELANQFAPGSTAFNPASMSAANPGQAVLDAIIDSTPVQTAVGAVQGLGAEARKLVDKIFKVLNLPPPTKVIGKPRQSAATVVYGQTSGSPVINTGTTPLGTQTGISTNNPFLDAAVNRIFGILTGGATVPDLGEISTVVIQEAAREALNLPAGADMGQITDAISNVGKAGVQVLSAAEDTEGTGLFDVDLTPGADNTKVTDAVDVLTTPDTTPDTTSVVGASTGDELPPVPRTGLPGAETPAITRTGLPSAEKSAVARTPLPDSEIEKILTDLGGLPAVAGGYDTPAPEIKTAAELTSSSPSPAGGGGGSGSTQIGGTRTVTVEPGPLVDIPGLYDISSDSIIPEYLGELIKRSQRQRAAEGGQVKKFNTGDKVQDPYLASLGAYSYDTPSGLSGSSGNTGVRGKLGQFVSDNAPALLTSALGGLFGLLDDDEQQPAGYQGGIPDYTAQRSLLPNAFDQTDRRPGSMGRRYFTDTRFVPTGETQGVLQGIGVPAPAVAATTPELDTEAFAASTPADTSADAIDVLTGAQPAAQSVAQPATQPVAQPVTQPVAQPVTQPATQPVVVQPPPPPPPTPYEAIPVDGEYTSGERDIVAEAIASGETTIPKAAGRFGVSTGDVIEELLRGNYQTPEQVIESLGYTGGVPGLIVELAAQGRTNPQEIVDYFGNNPAYPEYKNITVEEVTDYLRRAQVPGYREGGRLLFDDMGKSSDNPQFNPMSTTLSNRPTMGPPDPRTKEFQRETDYLERLRRRQGERTFLEGLRDFMGEEGTFDRVVAVDPDTGEKIIVPGSTFIEQFLGDKELRRRFMERNPELLNQIKAREEATARLQEAEGMAQGGIASLGGPNYLAGATDGMADLVPATIGGSQPAALSDGEFVIPADVVSHLGNGNSDAGAKELYAMMDRVRDERTGTTRQGPEINPMNMMPA